MLWLNIGDMMNVQGALQGDFRRGFWGGMKQAVITFLILAVPVFWLLYRPKLSIFKARLGRGVQVSAVVYFLILAVRLSTAPVDEEQLLLAGASVVLFLGVWLAAFLVTRAIEKTH